MKCKILHETTGRMRVHLPIRHMSLLQADMLEYYLEGFDFVKKAQVFERTSNVIIIFEKSYRKALLKALAEFSYQDTKLMEVVPEYTGREITRQYQEKLVNSLIFAGFKKFILPAPIRIAHTILKSIPYIYKGVRCLLERKLEVDLLDALSIGVSIIRGDYSTASSLMALLGLANLLEEWTHKKSVNDLARSMSLNIDKVWIKTKEAEIQVPISTIHTGDLISVRTGSIVPLDGVMVSGEAMINQASLTGESIPVRKIKGAFVYAGTVVEEGSCVLRVEAQSGTSRYDKIVAMIEASEKMKSNTETKAENLADRLVPYSLLGTACTYLFTGSALKALSVLMVDFSCALKLVLPLSVLSAMREAGNHKITVKGGKFLEALANADTIVFDKTGTLTYATPKVEEIIVCDGYEETEVLRIAACLEEHFPHSMANAVVEEAKSRGITHDEMHTNVEYVVAHGIASRIGDEKVIIGSGHFVFEDEACEIAEVDREKIDGLKAEFSHLYLAIGKKLVAVICIADPLRTEAREVLHNLKALGIKKTVMMTGDNKKTAVAIAKEVGVDEFYAEVLPEDKAKFIEKEKSKGRKVVMIGDGINDSPALSASDCGIAISEGAAIAREIADITISANDLRELVVLKKIANGLAKRNAKDFKLIMGINGSLIALGIFGVIAPATSSFLHNFSTLGISLSTMTDIA